MELLHAPRAADLPGACRKKQGITSHQLVSVKRAAAPVQEKFQNLIYIYFRSYKAKPKSQAPLQTSTLFTNHSLIKDCLTHKFDWNTLFALRVRPLGAINTVLPFNNSNWQGCEVARRFSSFSLSCFLKILFLLT